MVAFKMDCCSLVYFAFILFLGLETRIFVADAYIDTESSSGDAGPKVRILADFSRLLNLLHGIWMSSLSLVVIWLIETMPPNPCINQSMY